MASSSAVGKPGISSAVFSPRTLMKILLSFQLLSVVARDTDGL